MNRTLWVAVCGSALLCGGCFSAAKQGFAEIRGAGADVIAIREANPSMYRSIGELAPGRIVNSISPVCPSGTFGLLEPALREEFAKADAELTGSQRCAVDVTTTFYKDPAGLAAVVGKGAMLICRVSVAAEGETSPADLLVVAKSQAVRTEDKDLVEALAKKLTRHIVENARR